MGPDRLYSAATLIAVAVAADIMERRRPGFAVDRRRELPLNAAAMLVVIFAGEACKALALAGLLVFGPGIFSHNFLWELPSAAKLALAIVLTDLALYWVHRAMHRQPLWRTHAFHHSIAEIWWLSGSRTSVAHLFLFAVPQLFIAYFLLGLSPLELAAAFSFGVLVNIWIHTNLWVELGGLEKIFITPNFHRIHHGAQGLTNKNLAFVFTFWDRLFGTYVSPETTGKDFALFPVPTGSRLLRMMIGF